MSKLDEYVKLTNKSCIHNGFKFKVRARTEEIFNFDEK